MIAKMAGAVRSHVVSKGDRPGSGARYAHPMVNVSESPLGALDGDGLPERGGLHVQRPDHMLLDRDTKYSDAFRGILVREGIQVIRLPPKSPNLNAFAERFVRSIKEECLNRMIFVGQASLRHAIRQYLTHYHCERNHQGLENRLLKPCSAVGQPHTPVKRRERLGGMLSHYHREAA